MKLLSVVMCAIAHTAVAEDCSTGKKKIAKLADTACYLNVPKAPKDKKICGEAVCCEKDNDICVSKTVTCDAGKYKDAAKNTATAGDAPKTACCTSNAKCSAATCPAGYKKKGESDDYVCNGNADSCKYDTKCCIKDETLCGGITVACASGYFKDAAKFGNAKTDTPKTACCTEKAKCGSATFTCAKGQKKKGDSAKDNKCSGLDATCTATCCETDKTLCAFKLPAAKWECGTGKTADVTKAYQDAGKTDDEMKTNCCKDMPDESTCKAWSDQKVTVNDDGSVVVSTASGAVRSMLSVGAFLAAAWMLK